MSPRTLVCSLFCLALAPIASASTVRATYLFQSTLNAEEPVAPALVSVDPLASSGFDVATVQGAIRTVYNVTGVASPVTSQGGLVAPASLTLSPASYSVELVLLFSERNGSWRRILDVENRASDNGFYVSPSSLLYIYPVIQSVGSPWTNNEFHHVVMTVDHGTIAAYLDGTRRLTVASTIMDLRPNIALSVFLDNTQAGGQQEWSAGKLALMRLYDGALTDAQVGVLATNPFDPPAPPCHADFNADGELNADDLGDFITCYFSLPPCPGAEFNADGDINPDDLGDFITAYFTGCP